MSSHRLTRLCTLCFVTNAKSSLALFAQNTVFKRSWSLRVNRISIGRYYSQGDDLLKNAAVQNHMKRVLGEYKDIRDRLQSDALNESDRRVLHCGLAELSPVANTFQNLEIAQKELAEVEALLKDTTGGETEDKHMVKLICEEQHEIQKRIKVLNRKLVQTLLPSDAHDNCNVILEVSAGRTTGGDICQQFTREMFDMYQGFSSYKDWDFQVINYSPADYGGLHHAAVKISGEKVYQWLKFEGGTHRVQRIPEVGLSSRMQRIHTGTMTVIILPQPDDVDINFDSKDLRIDTFRSRGAGGQSVNTTDSAVRIVHLPTGIVAECQESRSQLQNRETAMRVLKARIYQKTLGQQMEERLTARKQQVGTRSQSERIRTYNFSQDRVIDHRIGYLTRDIKEFMKGGELLEELISVLQENAETEALLELVENRAESGYSNS